MRGNSATIQPSSPGVSTTGSFMTRNVTPRLASAPAGDSRRLAKRVAGLRRELEAQHGRALRGQEAHEVVGIVVADEGLARDDAAGPQRGLAGGLAHADPDDALQGLHVGQIRDDPAAVLAVGDVLLREVARD